MNIFNNPIYPLDRQKFAIAYKTVIGRFYQNPFTPQMIDKKILFVHIPKTGGSSVATALIGNPSGHPYLFEFFNANPKYTREFFKFCVVRNPFDRLVSTYAYILKKEDSPMRHKKILKQLNINSFEDLIKSLDNKKDHRILTNYIVHFRSQSELIQHSQIKMDRIFKFEEFNNIETELNTLLNENIKIKKLNASPRKEYKEYFNDYAINVTSRIYKTDLEMFDYKF